MAIAILGFLVWGHHMFVSTQSPYASMIFSFITFFVGVPTGIKKLRNVPEFAGGHHETLDGKGYPKGLTGDQMSVQAKMMAIADIYEALTASDRPYKDGKKLSHAMRIMGFMRNDYHIDEELFEIFVEEGVYKEYATKYLAESQLDEVDELAIIN